MIIVECPPDSIAATLRELGGSEAEEDSKHASPASLQRQRDAREAAALRETRPWPTISSSSSEPTFGTIEGDSERARLTRDLRRAQDLNSAMERQLAKVTLFSKECLMLMEEYKSKSDAFAEENDTLKNQLRETLLLLDERSQLRKVASRTSMEEYKSKYDALAEENQLLKDQFRLSNVMTQTMKPNQKLPSSAGRRISLISKSEIRYEGFLHAINEEENTVALKNVRMFGTEGRKGDPSHEIPAGDQIYNFINFRGAELKDLTVYEDNQIHDPAFFRSKIQP